MNENHNRPERPMIEPIARRLAAVAQGRYMVEAVVDAMPDEQPQTAREIFAPRATAAPAVSTVVELQSRAVSAAADSRPAPAMPLPAESGEVVDMDQYRRIKAAQELIDAA